MVPNIPSSAQDSTNITEPSIEFVEHMSGLRAIDLNSNLECFNENLPIDEESSNGDIVFHCLADQLGIDISDEEESRAVLISFNQAFREETPLDVLNQIRENEMKVSEDRFTETFSQLVVQRFDLDIPTKQFVEEVLAYSVVLSLTDKSVDPENPEPPVFRAKKHIYLYSSATKALESIFGRK